MVISIAKENREESERRVVMLPLEVAKLVKSGHNVWVEKQAGERLGIPDSLYEASGARIVSQNQAYSAEIILRIRAPNEQELNLIRPNTCLVCMLHRDTHPEKVQEFARRKIFLLELNELRNEEGKRLVEAFEISGTEGIKSAFALYNMLYKIYPQKVLLMGYGNMALPAIKAACRLGAAVIVLGRKQTKPGEIKKYLPDSQIIINATFRKPEEIGQYLLTKQDLHFLTDQTMIVDLSADPESCIETCRPTDLDNPYYFVKIGEKNIPHMCIYSLPGLNPLACSKRYSEQILPFILLLADMGVKKAWRESLPIRNALLMPGKTIK